ISVDAAEAPEDEEDVLAEVSVSEAEKKAEEEGNDPDAYAAAVKESADAVQGADGTGSDSSLGSKGTFVVWPFRSCIACCLKASFSTRSNVL
ncbi:unnamed protein product, partial [Cladocopium goreaui]